MIRALYVRVSIMKQSTADQTNLKIHTNLEVHLKIHNNLESEKRNKHQFESACAKVFFTSAKPAIKIELSNVFTKLHQHYCPLQLAMGHMAIPWN